MNKIIEALGILCITASFMGCASQPVIWRNMGPVDLTKGVKVGVEAACEMPAEDVSFLQSDIQSKVAAVLAGNKGDADAYRVKVVITKYDKGNAFARFMLIGLGQMHLDATVEVSQGEPTVVIREGTLSKNYAVGGLVGGSATMQKNVLPLVGKAIAEAIQQ